MVAVIMELHNSWKWVVLIEMQLSYNSTIHASYLLTLMTYKYNDLQVSCATQKLSCKANCETPFFFHSDFTIHY
jgi:hypothetical protein